MAENFYRAFEDRYRGTRGLIKSRLHTYLAFVTPLKENSGADSVATLDLGCGRGEWMELISEEKGFSVEGIDQDVDMLSSAKHLGLNAKQGDAIEYLTNLNDESLSLITAFHLIEHITFEDLQALIKQAIRVLKPGGLLIMETPNPENLAVGTESFYLDPTHKQPIPSKLLSFMVEFYGFKRHKIIRMQETIDLVNHPESVSLLDVIQGVSPDYAVVAQKAAAANILSQLDEPYNQEYGVTLTQLGRCYEDNIQRKLTLLENKIAAANSTLEELVTINDILQSTSWRITKPLRYIKNIFIRENKK